MIGSNGLSKLTHRLRRTKNQWLVGVGISVGLAFTAAQTLAVPSVKLSDPSWEFWLSNTPEVSSQTAQETALTPQENSLIRELQPLLAAQKYDQVAVKLRDRPLANDSAALQLLRGQVLLQIQDYTGAKAALQAALNQLPNAANAHRSLSVVYLLESNYTAAREHLSRALELGEADAETYAQLAYVNLQSGQSFAAIAGYQQALFLHPDNFQWQQGLVYALSQSGNSGTALTLVEDMLKNHADDSSLWLLRSQIALQQNQMATSLASLEAALRLGNATPENQLLAAQLHLQHGSSERAVALLEANLKHLKSLNQNAQQNTDTQNLLTTLTQASAWLAQQKRWQPLNHLLTAIELNQVIPAAARLSFAVPKAQALLAQHKTETARKTLRNALDADPTQGEALLLMADIHLRDAQPERAVMFLQRAQAINEFRERALLLHAQLEIDRQAYRQALPLLRQALQQNPSRHDLINNIRALEKLVRHQEV